MNILETKLHPPRKKSDLITREALLSLIHRHLDKKLLAIIAGAGYGKTTLLGQLLEREQLPAMYLSLDPEDGDPDVFLGYLLAGLMRLAWRFGPSTIGQSLISSLRNLEPELGGYKPRDIVGELINILSEHRVGDIFIMLDDYHWLSEGSQVHPLMDFFIERMPSFIHLIIGSRTSLPLASLARWRAKQEAFELVQEDLAFTQDEVRTLLALAYRASLPEGEIERVMAQTQGWITGIHLIMQAAGLHKSLKETLNGYVVANRPLFEYFAREILEGEEPAIRDFLIQTSVLEVFNGPACDYLLERKGSARILRQLERRHIFLTEMVPGQYRYHPLFRNYLMDNIAEEDRRRNLHGRAAEFYQRLGLMEQAVEHFLAAGSPERAAPLMVRIHDHLVGSARFETLGRWLAQLPPKVFQDYPQLLLPLSRWQLEQRRPEEQRRSLQQAADLLGRGRDRAHLCRVLLSLGQTQLADRRWDEAIRTFKRGLRLCPRSLVQLRAELYNTCGQAWLGKGHYDQARRYYRRALGIVQGARLPFESQVKIMVDLSVLQSRLGDYRTAYKQYRILISRLKPDHYYLGIGSLYASAAKAALTVGDPAVAEEFLSRGRDVCQRHRDIRSLAALDIIAAQADLMAGRWEKAEAELARLSIDCESLGSRDYWEAVQRSRAQLCRYRGRLAEAWELLEPFRQSFQGVPENYIALRGLSEKGFLEAGEGRREEAQRTARIMEREGERLGDKLAQYYALMIRAMALSPEQGLARKYLEGAREMARRWGYQGLFVLEIKNNPVLNNYCKDAGLYPNLTTVEERGSKTLVRPGDKLSLSVRLLGPAELASQPSGPFHAVSWKMRLVGSLFSYLAVNRHRLCQVEELMQAFWPRLAPARAKAKIYQAISFLRQDLQRALEELGIAREYSQKAVSHQGQGYRLLPEWEMDLDVESFDRLWRERIQLARVDDPELASFCQQALALYRGDFMPASGDRWSEERREQYYKRYLMIKEKLAQSLAATGQHQAAIANFEEYLSSEPFAEQVRLEYWRALLAVGNRRRIFDDYRGYVRLLRKEIGQPPGLDLISFMRALK